MKNGLLTEGTSFLLTNLLNGKSAYCNVEPDGDEKRPDYIEHHDLLEWGRKTGCYRAIIKLWNGGKREDFAKWPFIAITRNCASLVGLGIFRNKKCRDWHGNLVWMEYAKNDDKLAFMAEERISPNDYGKNPNRIPGKKGRKR